MAMVRSALFLKAWLPIEVTVSGIVIVRWEQYSNARTPIDWILSGIIMLRNETQPLNVALFIAVIFFGIFISESLVLGTNTPSPMEVRPSGSVTLVRFVHSLKASSPISVTLLGMMISVSPEHCQKAACPIDVTLSGIVTLTIPGRF